MTSTAHFIFGPLPTATPARQGRRLQFAVEEAPVGIVQKDYAHTLAPEPVSTARQMKVLTSRSTLGPRATCWGRGHRGTGRTRRRGGRSSYRIYCRSRSACRRPWEGQGHRAAVLVCLLFDLDLLPLCEISTIHCWKMCLQNRLNSRKPKSLAWAYDTGQSNS